MYGFAGLIARVPALGDWWISDHFNVGSDKPIVYSHVLPEGQLVPIFSTDKLIPGSNFPYGFVVTPD